MKQKNKYQSAVNKKKNPTGGLGLQSKNKSQRQINSKTLINVQGFCIQCNYFYLIKLPTGRIRKSCRFSGESLRNTAITHGCKFQHIVGVADV